MRKEKKRTCLWIALLLCTGIPAFAQDAAADAKGAEQAMMDYLDGFYEGDTAKIIRSVLPEVAKYGYWKDEKTGKYGGEAMSFQEMLNYANRVKERKRFPKPDAPKKVELFEVQDQTAAGKVTAWWGTDYILLGKYDGKWKIVQVLWQGPLGGERG
ncbi:MAG: nuclear transport factor 2 family protein [Lewinellaceae bacterium]|nr:nuclear transport factor 2 family protein [Lewinellaceae bacterium]